MMKKFPLVLLACCGLSFFALPVPAAPVISEFMASNGSTLDDEDGDSPDWIEIHNPDGVAIDLAGYHLTDEAANPTKWTFPATTLGAGEYLVVFASDKDRAVSGSELHTNFKLSAAGDHLALTDPVGAVLSSFTFSEQEQDVSFGESQELIETPLIEVSAPEILVPASAGDLAANWASVSFAPGAEWTTGTAPTSIGYDLNNGPVPLMNVGQQGTASQSTSHAAGPANNGNDGNSGNFSHTLSTDANGWWEVTLNADQEIHEVVLHNRDNCCQQRFRDLTVEIFDQNSTLLYTSPLLNAENVLNNPAEVTLDVAADHGSPVTGRIVRVTRTADPDHSGLNAINGDDSDANVLSLGEVEILVPDTGGGGGGGVQNLAPGGTATQTTTLNAFSASLGIDSNLGNFTHTTTTDPDPTWTLDLGSRSLLSEITLHNRTSCCADRLRDITVKIYDEDGTTVTFDSGLLNPNNVDGSPGLINLDLIGLTGGEVIGRTIEVKRTPDGSVNGSVLSLGEVEVMGLPSFGFDAFINDDIEAEALDENASAFVRIPFSVADASVFEALDLQMRYDAGFVAYLNGVEVARRNAPATPVWNSTATMERDNLDALQYEVIDLDAQVGLLTNGNNVLAIQMLNSDKGDVDFFMMPRMVAGQTNTNGGVFLVTATPGAQNNSAWYIDKVEDTDFDNDRGFYDAPFFLTIDTPTPGAQIRYTTDGTAPTETSGTLYTGPIEITGTTCLRAIGYKATFRSTNIDTHTFIFRDDVIASSVMSTSITQDPTYGPQLRDALTDLPTIALAFPGDIDRQEKHSSVEMIGFEGENFQVDAGMERFGSYVTNFVKRNIRLNFRDIYGPKKLNYDLFQGHDHNLCPVNSFDSLDLRSGSHDMNSRGFYMSARFMDDTLLDMGNINPHGRFIHVYVNGVYWGMYHLRERMNADMMATYLGGKKEDYEAVAGNRGSVNGFATGTPYDGDGSAWNNVKSLRNTYVGVSPYLDVAAFIDYMLLWFCGNSEAEFRAAGPLTPGSGYVLYHNDPDGFTRTPPDRTSNAGPEGMWQSLRSEGHPDFEVLLADRIEKHFKHGGAMTQGKAVPRLTERTDQIERAFLAESARWGYRTPASWESAKNSYIGGTLNSLSNTMYNRFDAAGYLPSSKPPVFSQHGGEVAPGYLLGMSTASAGTIYYTTDGTDPRSPGGAISPNAIAFTPSGANTETIIGFGDPWKYLDNGSDQGTAWQATAFDDSTWSSGNSELGYGDGGEATTVDFGPNSADKYITTYFRKDFTITNQSELTAAEIRLVRDDGAVVYVNGTEVERSNLPGSPAIITYETEASPSVSGSGETTPIVFSFSPSLLMEGSNTIAVEIHQSSPSSSDISFNLQMTVERPSSPGDTLSLTDNSHIRARTRGADWSGMTEAFFTVTGIAPLLPADVTISEIHYNPDGGSESTEFLELLNTGTRPVNLRGTKFTNGFTYAFPQDWDTVIHPGQRLVLVGNLLDMNALHGLGLPIVGVFKGNLSNSGELVTLVDENDVVLADVSFTDLSPWPVTPDGGGPSLTLIDSMNTSNLSDPLAWRSSRSANGTPGTSDETMFTGDPDADDDGNGLSNLLDYALGNTITPTEACPVLTTVSHDDGGGAKDYLAVSYRANLSDPKLSFIIQTSPDLVNWADGAAATELVEQVDQGDGTANVIVRSETAMSDLEKQFMRIRVVNTP